MSHIYLDAAGGDNAPQCTVSGALEALRADQDLQVTLSGPQKMIEELLTDCDDVSDRLSVDDAPEIIENQHTCAFQKETAMDEAPGWGPGGDPSAGWGRRPEKDQIILRQSLGQILLFRADVYCVIDKAGRR